MATLVSDLASVEAAPLAGDEAIRATARRLLSELYPRGRMPERRKEQRLPFPSLVVLHPVDDDGHTPRTETIVVSGKHLSESGLGFFHPEPLPYRRVVASLECPDGQWIAFLLDVSWCRFSRYGWYESGGRFLQTVDSPLADQQPAAVSAIGAAPQA